MLNTLAPLFGMAEVVTHGCSWAKVNGNLAEWMDRLEFERYTTFWLDMTDEELRTSVRTSVRASVRRIRPSAADVTDV